MADFSQQGLISGKGPGTAVSSRMSHTSPGSKGGGTLLEVKEEVVNFRA